MATKYDLLIKGGKVIDASLDLQAECDVAFVQGRVAAVAAHIPEKEAREVYDAGGKIVTPGLVDIHTHFYYGVDPVGVDSRRAFLPAGVTCAVDGGGAGSAIYPGLRDLIIKPSQLHLYAFLNLFTHGVTGGLLAFSHGYRLLDMADVESTAKMLQSNHDTIIGVKLILQVPEYSDPQDYLSLLERAVEAAEEAQCPILCHIAGQFSLRILVDHLRPGDTITHCFHSNEPNIIDERGKVRSEIVEAVNKGIILDTGSCGNFNMAWKIAEAAARDGLWPHTISTDYSDARPFGWETMFTLPDCMSIMMNLGMPLAKVVEAATSKPAAVIGKADNHGSLKPGVAGDAAVFEMQSGEYSYLDMNNEQRTFDKRLAHIQTVLGGRIWQAPGEK